MISAISTTCTPVAESYTRVIFPRLFFPLFGLYHGRFESVLDDRECFRNRATVRVTQHLSRVGFFCLFGGGGGRRSLRSLSRERDDALTDFISPEIQMIYTQQNTPGGLEHALEIASQHFLDASARKLAQVELLRPSVRVEQTVDELSRSLRRPRRTLSCS